MVLIAERAWIGGFWWAAGGFVVKSRWNFCKYRGNDFAIVFTDFFVVSALSLKKWPDLNLRLQAFKRRLKITA